MVRVTRTFTVSTPIEKVVEYLSDFGHAEQWDPGTKTCKRVDTGPVHEGSSWTNVSQFRGKETTLDYRLLKRQPRRLVFEGRNKRATSTDDINLSPVGGGTLITYEANIAFHGVLRLVGWAVQGEFNRLGDRTAEQMTRVLNAL
ncbi:Carbon monoxide dehydrogenase subunit G [Nakamurella panacisegetis]|uniref:Carbon monoxide dehydrogenase subunit G n=1 Tax=Nakamurella panacisegetis TaxID=1090615 RepID=A0A1H0NL76_9ACTN|nr:SRPBCC family protein [Nakamurella panacisegetis]SDO93100.1 Carbon monoxide dehydrogenase subunit G [Nakamurella panacisegetis]